LPLAGLQSANDKIVCGQMLTHTSAMRGRCRAGGLCASCGTQTCNRLRYASNPTPPNGDSVASTPEAIVEALRRGALNASACNPVSSHTVLCHGLTARGWPVTYIDARYAKACPFAESEQDANDALGVAIMRVGWYREVAVKATTARRCVPRCPSLAARSSRKSPP
jgi:hypothetical protein